MGKQSLQLRNINMVTSFLIVPVFEHLNGVSKTECPRYYRKLHGISKQIRNLNRYRAKRSALCINITAGRNSERKSTRFLFHWSQDIAKHGDQNCQAFERFPLWFFFPFDSHPGLTWFYVLLIEPTGQSSNSYWAKFDAEKYSISTHKWCDYWNYLWERAWKWMEDDGPNRQERYFKSFYL